MRLAENTGCKKSPAGHHRTTLSGHIFATKARIDNRKKNFKQQYLLHMSHNRPMVNFGPVAALIVSLVWGTPANFNGFRVLVALLHGSPVLGVSQTAALNRGRHASGWALAHISSFILIRNRTFTNTLPPPASCLLRKKYVAEKITCV